jgi:Photosynthesis system II assembly factor YCF48
MPSDERDRQFERALQRHLRGSAACADAETLAGYHERTLSVEEMSQWKEHIVTCWRCQEILALLEETNSVALHEWEEKNVVAPPVFMGQSQNLRAAHREVPDESSLDEATPSPMQAAAALKHVSRSTWRWIIPVGALAAGLLVFVAVRENKGHMGTSQPAVEIAQNRDAMATTTKPEEVPQAARPEKSATPKADAVDGLARKTEPRQKLAAPAPPSNQASSQESRYAREAAQADKLAKDKESGAKSMGAESSLRQALSIEGRNSVALSAGAVAPSPPPPPPPQSARKAAAPGVAGDDTKLTKPATTEENKEIASASQMEMVQNEAPEVNSQVLPRDITQLQQIALKDSHIVQAPDGKHAWRVGAAGKIEATNDAGKTWKLQQSGVSNDLTAGSAPSKRVCWVVGKAGTVLMTSNGGTQWKQLASPLQEDLGRIHAADSQHATVRDAPNQKSFATVDGGATWIPAANE